MPDIIVRSTTKGVGRRGENNTCIFVTDGVMRTPGHVPMKVHW